MTNELLFLTRALIGLLVAAAVARLGRSWLVVMIVLDVVLIGVFGAKLITLFGLVTNTGNSLYAAAFFATQLLTEHYGKKEALRSIWIVVWAMIFFMLMGQFTLLTVGIAETQAVNQAIDTLFSAAPRVAAASVIAFILAQLVNINVFSYFHKQTHGRKLWLRVNGSNIVGQAVDSLIFFTIAFWGVVSTPVLIQTMLVGYGLKVGVGLISTFFFYLSAPPLDQDQSAQRL